jgi:inositol 1,4,5-triphosphate receptor type 1
LEDQKLEKTLKKILQVSALVFTSSNIFIPDAIFKVAPKNEYSAATELKKALKDKDEVDQELISRIKERVEVERQLNEREEKELLGQVVYYGQTVQLLHTGTGMFLAANKQERSELNPSCLKVELHKKGGKACWWKISPRFKVRFEGERVSIYIGTS